MKSGSIKTVKLVDVAKAAKVSLTTAYMAISNRPEVNPQTKERILEISKNLGYRPLRKNTPPPKSAEKTSVQTKIGFLLIGTKLNDEAHSLTAHQMQEEVYSRGIRLEVSAIEDARNFQTVLERTLRFAQGLDGLIISNLITMDLVHAIQTHNIPCVALGGIGNDLSEKLYPIHAINSDAFFMGQLAAQHLIDAGHRRIGFVCEDIPKGQTNHLFLMGYREAILDAGLPLHPEFIHISGVAFSGGKPAAEAFHALDPAPTAYFVADVRVAASFIASMKILYKDVSPANTVIIGDGELALRYQLQAYPRLEYDSDMMVHAAVSTLIEVIQNPATFSYTKMIPFKTDNFDPTPHR